MPARALALFTRELRVDVRRRRSHLLRLAFAGLIFIAMAVTEASSGTKGAPGYDFFCSITAFNFTALTLAGVSWFATAVSEDKDEGTFDLLKLAGIGAAGLLLGRSTTRLLATLLILAVQLPFTFLAVTLGGVVPEQVLAVYVSLAAYAVLLANAGLLCSVIAPGSAVASGLAIVLAVCVLAGPPVLEFVWNELATSGVIDRTRGLGALLDSVPRRFVREFSIVTRLTDILRPGYSGGVWSSQTGSHLAAAGVLFALSQWRLSHITRASRSPRGLLRRRRTATRRPRRVWSQALLWKDVYGVTGGPALLVLKLAVFVVLPIAFARLGEWDRRTYSESTMVLMLILLAGESSLYASLAFRADVRNQTLPLLAVLPVSMGRIAATKAAAILLALVPGLCCFVLAAAASPAGFWTAVSGWLARPADWLLLVQFLIFLHAAAYLSLWVKWGALPLALLAVYASTYVLGFCCVFPSLVFAGSYDPVGTASSWRGLILPMVLAAACVIVWLQFALVERLRVLAGR